LIALLILKNWQELWWAKKEIVDYVNNAAMELIDGVELHIGCRSKRKNE